MNCVLRLCACIIAAATLLALVPPAAAATIDVSAAASLSDVLRELATQYERASGNRVRLNFGASSTLARQIEAGAPADVFLSADEEKMNRLERLGRIDAPTRRSFLSNRLVIVVADDSATRISSSRDLLRPSFRRIALAEPSTVPAGIYGKEHFQRLGIWRPIEKKVVPLENVRAALAAAAAGNVDAAVVYATDAASNRRVRVAFEIPIGETPEIRYPFALVTGAKKEAALAFLDFLGSKESKKTFRRFGFVIR